MKKQKTYWAGFSHGKIDECIFTPVIGSGSYYMPELFLTRKDARKRYMDVRKVRIVEVKS